MLSSMQTINAQYLVTVDLEVGRQLLIIFLVLQPVVGVLVECHSLTNSPHYNFKQKHVRLIDITIQWSANDMLTPQSKAGQSADAEDIFLVVCNPPVNKL